MHTWKEAKWVTNDQTPPLFEKWVRGETGNPMVDANMRELASTGYMSNRGRLVVSFYLVYDLQGQCERGIFALLTSHQYSQSHSQPHSHSHY